MRAENFNVQELIDYLEGTLHSLDEGLETCFPGMDSTDLNTDDHQKIDDQIFCCETCGWWFTDSQDSEGNCSDCSDEEEED